MSFVFFMKLRAVYYKVATLLRSLSVMDFFLKILFFKIASFGYIFQKVSVMSYLNNKVASEHCIFVTLLKGTPS